MAKPHLSFVVFFVCAAFASAGHAQSVSNLTPTQDSFVSQVNTANNYGGAGALEISSSQNPPNTNGEYDALMEFNLTSAITQFNSAFGPGQWTIQSMTLKLTNTSPNNGIFNANTSGSFNLNWMSSVTSSNNWVEGTGTPASPGITGITAGTGAGSLSSFQTGDEPLGTYTYTGSNTGSNTYTLGSPSGFLSSVTAGNIVSIDILPVESSNLSMLVSSRSGANAPVLAVTAVPEPASVALLFGSALLAGSRRRRR